MAGKRAAGRGLALLLLAIGLTLISASAASADPPATLVLTPETDTNVVGAMHTVTATVRDASDNPADPRPRVVFTVTGANTASGNVLVFPHTSFRAGEADFSYTGTSAGTDTITAFADTNDNKMHDSGEPSDTATKTWTAGPPANLTLAPSTDTNPVGTQHCVTADPVTDAFGNTTAKVTVRFSVTGSVNTRGARTSGDATFCYSGPPLPGSDVITAFADTDGDAVQDSTEPGDTATKEWVLPESTPGCEVTNGVRITAANGDRATAGGDALVDAVGNVSGEQVYQDHGPATRFTLEGDVLAVVCTSESEATIFGEATIDGTGSHIYRIDVEDNDEPGKGADRYRMRVNTYDSGLQTLEGGNVQVDQS